jgi:hypothetical protein
MRKTKHGMCYTPTYRSWQNMKRRCYDTNNNRYKYYGGRGISVCDRWLESFANFYADMGKKPSPKHTIERKRTDGNYEPSNCAWATRAEQNRNYGRNVRVELGGDVVIAQDADASIGLRKGTVARRMKRGWTATQATSCPLVRSRAPDLSGMRVGKLVAICRAGSNIGGAARRQVALWECRCDCGKLRVVRADLLKGGLVTHCGCQKKRKATA